VVRDKLKISNGKVAKLESSVKFLSSKIAIYRKLGKKEAQSRASRVSCYKSSLGSYWEALDNYYTANFKVEGKSLSWRGDAVRNMLVAALFIHRSPLRSQNILSLKLHKDIRIGEGGGRYEMKLDHNFKTSGSGFHGPTHWVKLPHHISYWMAIFVGQVRPTYKNWDKTDYLFLTKR